jgi:(p)ppGpp synthase/HD superfamily hydrolase
MRFGTDKPYILHPIQVAAIISTITGKQSVIVAGALHDLLKDTDTTADTIREMFGRDVAELVEAGSRILTGAEPTAGLAPAEDWERRKQASVELLQRERREEILMLVLADKLSNVAAMKGDYAQAGAALWSRFHQTDPSRQAWYYCAVRDATASLSMTQAWQAYTALVNDFFSDYKDA